MSKFIFEVYESGRERHDGEFDTTFLRTDSLSDAFAQYNKVLSEVLNDNDFFLSDMLDEAIEGTHTPSAFDYNLDLPTFEIYDNDNGQYYELSIRVVEVESKSKMYAIAIARQYYEDRDDELSQWNEYHPILFTCRRKAEAKMKALMKEEFDDLSISRGNTEDYFIDEVTNTIYDSETGIDFAVATYSIIEFDDTEADYE